METKGAIYAFINFKQAANFGHLAWGFRLPDNSYCFGSSDHLWKHDWWNLAAWIRYMDVPAGGDIDWWCERGSQQDMLEMMKFGKHKNYQGRHIYYHAFKEIEFDLSATTPELALAAVEDTSTGGWHLAKNNCVHQSYTIFSKYNKTYELPNPFDNPLDMIPKSWFSKLSVESNTL